MVPYKDGAVLLCRQVSRDIVIFKDGAFTPLITSFEGHQLNSPNDMIFSANGTLWITDPPYATRRARIPRCRTRASIAIRMGSWRA